MYQVLKNVLRSHNGRAIFSVIWGLGLASLFKKACKGRNCIVYRAPAPEKVRDKVFRFDNKCYTYTPRTVACTANPLQTEE
jgi:hypothetical protein